MIAFMIFQAALVCFIGGIVCVFNSLYYVAAGLLVSSLSFLALGKIIDLLTGIHLYNQILTEKMAGAELAEHIKENK
jgi:hypothetical protein